MESDGDQSAALARFADGPEQLERALEGLDEAGLDIPVFQDGWTARQVVDHIVDGDDLWKLCIKSALGNEEGEFTLEWYWRLPQEVWADRWKYSARSIEESITLFKAIRRHVLQLLEYVPDAWQKSIAVRTPLGAVERITVGAVIRMQADHAVHHIRQIAAIRGTGGAS